MIGRSLIITGLFMQKSFESGGGDCWGRTSSAFPLLQCLEFGGHTGGNERGDCLGLAQIVGLPPRLEPENDRSRGLLRRGRFMVLQKEPFKRCRGHSLRSGTRSLPLLKRAKLYWQATGYERTDHLRLTQSPGRPPSFKFCDHRVERLTGHQKVYHADSASL
jgi:hypothetical protein